jgi:thiol-disulfide isomerase/thioredoxin
MKSAFLFLVLTLICSALPTTFSAQTITAHFPAYANEEISLTGFVGLNTYAIAKTKADAQGHFTLSYNSADRGMGYLMDADKKAYFVVLSGEDIVLQGGYFAEPNSVECSAGKEQQAFIQYAAEHPRREQAISAWSYLERIYTLDSLFANHGDARVAIGREQERIFNDDKAFLASLDPQSYVRWFLPVRKLVSSVSTIAQYRSDEIPATIAAFRQMDYTDPRLYKSGLYKEAIESHYWLLENMGRSLDSVYLEMNTSTDYLLANLEKDEKKFNEITNYLFDLLERHSLFDAAEYLALKALTQGSCTLNDDLAKQLETYRAMKKGNVAPEISFTGERLQNGTTVNSPSKLSELKAGHKLIVFGASWCPKCTEEIPQIASLYGKWKQQGMEVVYISLDNDPQAFRSFAKSFPFLSYCDYNKWESTPAIDYYVFATPTMFLLDAAHTIVLRPNSVKQVDAWADWYLKK